MRNMSASFEYKSAKIRRFSLNIRPYREKGRESIFSIIFRELLLMNDFGINEMLEMQKALQEKYKDKWKPLNPDRGKDQLL